MTALIEIATNYSHSISVLSTTFDILLILSSQRAHSGGA